MPTNGIDVIGNAFIRPGDPSGDWQSQAEDIAHNPEKFRETQWGTVANLKGAFVDAPVDTVKGVYFVVRHPCKTWNGVKYAASNPRATASAMLHHLTQKIWEPGGFGEIVGTVYITFITLGIGGEAKAAGTVGEVSQTATEVAAANAKAASAAAQAEQGLIKAAAAATRESGCDAYEVVKVAENVAIKEGMIKKRLLYEIGQKTLLDEKWGKYSKYLDPVTRGRAIVENEGWIRAVLPEGYGWWLGIGKTLHTGPTPSVWLFVGVNGTVGQFSYWRLYARKQAGNGE